MHVIIPARLASSRLERKVLLPLGGLPMLVRTAQIAQSIGLSCVVATDSDEVLRVCDAHGLRALLTSQRHQSGSERLAEAAELLGLAEGEIIVNLQADEPFFAASDLRKFCDFAAQHAGEYFMASAYARRRGASDANKVKVVCAQDGSAMYFSRAQIPYWRDGAAGECGAAGEQPPCGESAVTGKNSSGSEQPPGGESAVTGKKSSGDETASAAGEWLHHIGIYAYSAAALKEFVNLPSKLEHIEKLEQLRALENGKKILMCELVAEGAFGIDSPQDYEKARKILGDI